MAVIIKSGKTEDTTSEPQSHNNPTTSQSCPSMTGEKVRFNLKPGEFLFDKEGSTQTTMSLATYIHMISAENVFGSLFTHSQIVQKDVYKCCASFYNNPIAVQKPEQYRLYVNDRDWGDIDLDGCKFKEKKKKENKLDIALM